MATPNQSLFGGMQVYSPVKMDDDDKDVFGQNKVGNLLDMGFPQSQPAQVASQSS